MPPITLPGNIFSLPQSRMLLLKQTKKLTKKLTNKKANKQTNASDYTAWKCIHPPTIKDAIAQTNKQKKN